jgi:hypothetical protein
MCFDSFSYPVREMGGRGPPCFSGVFFGIGKWGAEALLSFRGVFRFAGKGGGRGPRRHIRLFARTRKMGGAEAIPAFRFKFCVGMLLRQNEFIGGWRWEKPTQEKMTALESRQASQGSDVLVLFG